jgi:hypothetical protein
MRGAPSLVACSAREVAPGGENPGSIAHTGHVTVPQHKAFAANRDRQTHANKLSLETRARVLYRKASTASSGTRAPMRHSGGSHPQVRFALLREL